MNKHPRPTPAKNRFLPFEEWMRQRYPEATPGRQLLRMIGAFDLLYLLYRAGLLAHMEQPAHEIEPIRRATRKTAAVKKPADEATPAKAKRTKKATRRAGARTKTANLVLEFPPEAAEPLPEPSPAAEENTPDPEPEPLVLHDDTTAGPAASDATRVWLDDDRLEDADPRKTNLALGIGGIAVSFETREIDDEPETLLVVHDIPYRVSLVSPSMNLSAMLQIARVTYGELYVLGRAALGALSGEGYVSAVEAERIVRALHAAGTKPVDLDVVYATKDAKTRQRDMFTLRVRFEPI